jgi:HD-GYP domain-containing protein (c-di-GMP phosphodiesterase class II)
MQKLGIGHAVCGVPLPWDVYDDAGQLLLRKGFVIDHQKQLDSLMDRGMFVNATNIAKPVHSQVSALQRYEPFKLWDDIVAKLGHVLRNYSSNDVPGKLQEIVELIQVLTERSKDAALAAMILLQEQNRYSLVHCLHAALLCDMVAIRLDWDSTRRTSVVCAALTMNISTVDMQQKLAEQIEPLTPDQRIDIRHHPQASREILSHAGIDDPIWLRAVHEHHETPLGTGYPNGIKEVGEEATLLRTADVFSAKISPRKNRKQMNGAQAARVLFTDPGMTTDNPFIAVLIKEVGIYPPGSMVKLANGEIGIVFKRSSNAHTPLVLSLTNSRGTPEQKPIRRDTSRQEFKILSVIPRDSIGLRINPASVWVT